VHELFEEQVERTPLAVGLADAAREMTYRELNERADAVADALRRAGIGPEESIGLWGRGSAEATIALLGILKAGAVYVPLAVDSPPARIEAILEDAGIQHVIACGSPEWPLEGGRCHRLSMADLLREPERQPGPAVGTRLPGSAHGRAKRPPRTRPEPETSTGSRVDAVACVIYTSGTSGRPKGVTVRHRSIVNLLSYRTQSQFRTGDFRVAPLTTPLNFDGSLVQILSPLLTGGTLVTARTPEDLAESPWYARLTAITGAPSLIAEIARRYGFPASVRVIGLGAEPVPAELLDHVVKTPTIERLITAYGMTECACYSTSAVLYDRGAHCAGSPPPSPTRSLNDIGRPIANTQVYVLGRDRQPVPIDVPGELYIGGEGLARGYLNRPELTAERFVPSPFAPDQTLYRTGDRVRWNREGTLEFLGRVDDQVKIRGFRIEPAEVEAALSRHPKVRQSAVIAREDRTGHKALVGYVVAAADPPPSGGELRQHLSRTLPEYMIPASFVSMPTLPLTPSGKVDRRALPAPTAARPELEPPFAAPRTASEERLARIWCEVLGLERVGIRDDFFAIGGHSLLALRVWARIKETFGQDHPIATLFRHRTIEDLAAALREGDRTERPSATPPEPGGAADSMPTLFCVDALAAMTQYLDDIPTYPVGFYTDEHLIWHYDSLVERAKAYVERLRQRQPKGPYRLCGSCAAASTAFEMARQLHEQGEEIPLLVLISPRPVGSASKGHRPLRVLAMRYYKVRLRHHLERVRRMPLRSWPSYWAGRVLAFLRRLAVRAKLAPSPMESSEFWRIRPQLRKALSTYQPAHFAGRVTVLAPKQSVDIHQDTDLGWGRVAGGGVDVYVMPGDHHSLLRDPEALRCVAQKIRAIYHESCRPRCAYV
jgi:amino acid adenylation domain-containing protein